ncbi:MAG TPA: aminopeptidase N [Allosphingosinicella sp.]|jgi:aminopeptidase N
MAHRQQQARPPAVRRADYRPPNWLVPEVELAFDISAERVRVRSRLQLVRNGAHAAPLRLDGVGLKLVSLLVDGKPASHKLDKAGLTVRVGAESAVVEIVADLTLDAAAGKGLWESGGVLRSQCEPDGFRRIAFFPDRPDVLSRFRVRVEADRAAYPVLLCNGNRTGQGELEGGRHWLSWDDPHPKPAYLFALVAGHLAAARDRFVARSGSSVDLALWTPDPADLPRTGLAMAALKEAMAWDEGAFGREYELDAYHMVALPDFTFGAMENKGLVLFNSQMILADPTTSTDAEQDAVAAVVAHEYLHNWSGNRVTLRDWFEMALKEGFTVLRDQLFCESRGDAAVKRIEDVRAVRAGQSEGPPRPECYADPAELLSAAVYAKGAEIFRMLRTVVGETAFRAGCDLYFARHDGQAARCEDFVAALEEGSGQDLSAFLAWFGEARTPRVSAALHWDAEAKQARLALSQHDTALPIPLVTALFAEDGNKLAGRLLLLNGGEAQFVFDGVDKAPLLSINRGFSAPVVLEIEQAPETLARLAAVDDDPVARWDALQALMLRSVQDANLARVVIEAVAATLAEPPLSKGFKAEAVSLPSLRAIVAATDQADPEALFAERERLRQAIGRALEPQWRAAQADREDGKAARRLRGVALDYLMASGAADAPALALRQFETAGTMTDRDSALRALADSDAPERVTALAAYHLRYRSEPALLDRWFTVQAFSARADTVTAVPKLLAHPDFTVAHPTRLWALVGAFTTNPRGFHHASGRGYLFVADVARATDRLNGQAAARLLAPLTRGHRLEPGRAALMRVALERVRSDPAVSAALRDQAAESLAQPAGAGSTTIS